ncbi:MAG: hypothetical protein AAFY71_17005 [Bacteroidota bacterium]
MYRIWYIHFVTIYLSTEMMMDNVDPKEFLLFGLKHYELGIVKEEGKYIHVEKDYLIEIEGPSLFKLMHKGQVIAPFGSVESLCDFLKQDISLNYG